MENRKRLGSEYRFSKEPFHYCQHNELLNVFPNLRHMDLRENTALDYRAIRNSGISIRSDCKFVSFATAFT